MEVISCSEVQYGGESDGPQPSSGRDLSYKNESNLDEHGQQVQLTEVRVDNILQCVERPQTEIQVGVHGTVDETQGLERHCNGASHVSQAEDQKLFCGSHSYDDDDDANEQNYCEETSVASENCHLIVDTVENELPNSNREADSSFPEPTWLEEDESVALWVKVLFISFTFIFPHIYFRSLSINK